MQNLLQGEWAPEDPNDVIPNPYSCIWVACVDAPHPTNGSGLTKLLYNGTDYDRQTTEVEKGQSVEYRCFNGMRNRVSPDLSAVQGCYFCVLFPFDQCLLILWTGLLKKGSWFCLEAID